MLVLYYDIEGETERELRFWNTQTKTTEVQTEDFVGVPSNNFYGKFVDAWQVNETTFQVFKYSPGIEEFNNYNYATLLKVENSNTPGYKKISYYDQPTKTIKTVEEPYVEPKQTSRSGNSPALNNFSLPDTTVLQSYCVGTTKREDYHDGNGGIAPVLYENSVTCGFVVPSTGVRITEQIPIKIDKTCYKNPVLLCWKNDLGGWDNWLFNTNQEVISKFTSRGTARKNVFEIAEQTSNVVNFGAEEEESVIVGAEGLTSNEYFGIKQMFKSQKVYIVPSYSQISAGAKYTEVTVREATISKFTRNVSHQIAVEIILPQYLI